MHSGVAYLSEVIMSSCLKRPVDFKMGFQPQRAKNLRLTRPGKHDGSSGNERLTAFLSFSNGGKGYLYREVHMLYWLLLATSVLLLATPISHTRVGEGL